MRLRARIDANQQTITQDARHCGFQVHLLHQIGKGFPDSIWCKAGSMWLIEFKMPKGKLTPDQARFHAEWQGPPIIIGTSFEEIYEKIKKV